MNSASSAQSGLIVVPGTANYFYNQAGRRVAEALRELGWQTRVETLAAAAALNEPPPEWCFLVNLSELLYSRRAEADGRALIAQLRQRSRRAIHVLLECAGTRWFEEGCRLGAQVGVDALFDLGLHDQRAQVAGADRAKYQFILNGLLAAEAGALQTAEASARPLPWTVVGHQTPERVKLVARLIREFDPRGFCYLPHLEPVTEDGPHLNEQQFQRVLERTQYQVWCSHHRGFYLEGERFRASLLAGGVPLKVLLHAAGWRRAAPLFDYLILDEADFPERMRALDFPAVRQRFVDEFCHLPKLAAGLAAACQNIR